MRLIDADALADKIGDRKYDITKLKGGYKYCNLEEKDAWDTLDEFEDMIDEAPTVEPKKAEWIGDENNGMEYNGNYEAYKCSNCGYVIGWRYLITIHDSWRADSIDHCGEFYCPHCGADMR